MPELSDNAWVVRGGLNSVEQLKTGAGVVIDNLGNLHGLSVNCSPDKTVAELAESLRYGQIGVTTVGEVRAAGGNVNRDPTPYNPDHCLLSGISAETAHRLLTPTVSNPSRVR